MKAVTLISSLLILLHSQVSTAASSDMQATGSALENESQPAHLQFESTEKALQKAPYGQAASLVLAQRDNVLYPYLQYQLHQRFPNMLTQEDVSLFLTNYPLLPKRSGLQRTWLDYLAKQKRWEDWIVAYQRLPITSAEYQCGLARAYLNTDQTEQGMALAEELWTVGKSQPKECDPVFSVWMKAGNPTTAAAARRYWLAAENGEMQLARYLHRFMAKADSSIGKKYETLRRNSKLVPGADLSIFPQSAQVALIKRSFQKLARGNAETTAERWLNYRSRFETGDKLLGHLDQYIGKRLAYEQTDTALTLLGRIDPTFQYPELTEARLRQALSAEQINWGRVQDLIAMLPADLRQSDRWQYWYATTLEHPDTPPPSVEQQAQIDAIFEQLAQNRSFYGFLAAGRLNLPFDLNDEPVEVEQLSLGLVQQNPAIQRAQVLLKLDRRLDAQREWNSARASMSAEERSQLAVLSTRIGWHHRAIMDAIGQRQWNYLDARFPALFEDEFAQQASKNNIDTVWATAIARQESAFKINAQSPVGARGLMQLMPATASHTAKKHKLSYNSRSQLDQPATNIKLGTAYLADMYQNFSQNRAYATAAYNAGPHRVKQWLKERGHLPLDAWIETIPYAETRNYVQNVLAFRVIYAQRAGQEVAMLSPSERLMLAYQQGGIASDESTETLQ